MRAPGIGFVAIAAATLAVAGCTIENAFVVSPGPEIVVHAVLDPGSVIQEILVERTLTGTINIDDKIKFDPLDPINTGEGVPVIGATVTITGPDGPLTGLEVHYTGKAFTYGAGRYVVATPAKNPIRPGGTYTLSVRTSEGKVVTGRTLIPNSNPVTAAAAATLFDRQRDSLALTWAASPGARIYGVRIESPFGAFMLFTDSTHSRIPGMITNLFASDLQHVFIPGFLQTAAVYAVDVNYFDYYRSQNDPFTGSGIINHLDGGIGVFGASVVISSRIIDVTQATKEPALEGTWQAVRVGSAKPVVDNFRVYVETPSAASTSLSGSYVKDATTGIRDGWAGARDGTRIELQFLNNQDAKQTYVRYVGIQMADSLVGSYTNNTSTRVVFKKRS